MRNLTLRDRVVLALADCDASNDELTMALGAKRTVVAVLVSRLRGERMLDRVEDQYLNGRCRRVYRLTPAGRSYAVQLHNHRSVAIRNAADLKRGDMVLTPSGRHATVLGFVGDAVECAFNDDGEEFSIVPYKLRLMVAAPPRPMPPGFMGGADRIREGRAS